MTLKEVAVGQTVKVAKLNGEGPVKRRIMDMGITKGVEVYVRKVAPLGDPIEVTVRITPYSLVPSAGETPFGCSLSACVATKNSGTVGAAAGI